MNDRNDILAVIPTYNNEKTVARVIADVRRYCAHVLVVNDGSTDSTAQILAAEGVGTISYAPNRGKGYAIRRALRYAEEHGYRYMITIDSDGQHFASDIPKFVEEIEKTPLMTLLPPKGEASALPEEPVSDGAEEEAPAESLGEPVREEPDEALIRAFEAEMAKAGAVVHEYGVETAPGMADASGVPDEAEAPALSADAVDQAFAEMHLEAQEPPCASVWKKPERLP